MHNVEQWMTPGLIEFRREMAKLAVFANDNWDQGGLTLSKLIG